ncbi:MAG: hypothetical protein K2X87_05085 [Gemmataceae bacterium]|nr:hypothetical protein [Gemmataceae bacterium]
MSAPAGSRAYQTAGFVGALAHRGRGRHDAALAAWERADRASRQSPLAVPYERFLVDRLRAEAMAVWDIPAPRPVPPRPSAQ